MRLKIAGAFAVIFGSLYTIFRKYQNVAILDDSSRQFNQPLIQAFIIFMGMTTIYFFRPFIPIDPHDDNKKTESRAIYLLPSLLDVLGTICDTAGLFYTSVSVSQMLKGSVLFFTYLISIMWSKRKLSLKQHLWMIAIVGSLLLIGYSNIPNSNTKYQSNPLLGNCLVIFSQLIFAVMFMVQEKISNEYNMQVGNAVLWEGIWGVAISGIFLLGFSQFSTEAVRCDILDSCQLICRNWNLLGAILITALCIAPFNYFGLMITKRSSALQRCMICTSRMVVVWMISMALGWENFSMMQFVGYCILTFGIYQFNNSELKVEIQVESEEQQPIKQTIALQETQHSQQFPSPNYSQQSSQNLVQMNKCRQ